MCVWVCFNSTSLYECVSRCALVLVAVPALCPLVRYSGRVSVGRRHPTYSGSVWRDALASSSKRSDALSDFSRTSSPRVRRRLRGWVRLMVSHSCGHVFSVCLFSHRLWTLIPPCSMCEVRATHTYTHTHIRHHSDPNWSNDMLNQHH